MLPVNIDLKSEDITRAIADAVVHSQIGEALKKVIAEKIGSGYGSILNDALGKVVDQIVREHLAHLLRTQYTETIQKAVAANVTEELVTRLMNRTLDRWNRD